MTYPEIVESFEHWIKDNPNGGLIREIQFAVGSDALLMGKMPPSEGEILASITQAPSAKGLQRSEALVRVTPVQGDDWMYQRIPCDVVDRIRRVLAETINICGGHTDKPTLAGVDIWELVEALRVKL